ncbi:interferon-induced very large GTPase 1-like, partial [Tachysurus ichikawai]
MDLGLNSSLCNWILNFLSGRAQVVKVGQYTSNSITLNVGAPKGCVLSPLLYSLYTHDCVSSHSSTSIIKFADDIVLLGLIHNNNEIAYLDEVERLTSWCQDNCLSLNVSKTKELIIDFRKRQQQPCTPLMISGTPVERVSSFSSSQDCKALQRVMRLAERITGSALPSLQDIYLKGCKNRATKIIKDSIHPNNYLFTLLPSGKHFRSLMAKTERLRSFFPQAIRLLNSKPAS